MKILKSIASAVIFVGLGASANESQYVVPLPESSALKAISKFSVNDGYFEEEQGALTLSYSIPEELVGRDPSLKAVFRTTFSGVTDLPTMPIQGLLVKGPCRWPFEKSNNSQLPLCPDVQNANDDAVLAIGKGRCRWLTPHKKLNCHLAYSSFKSATSIDSQQAVLREKFGSDSALITAYRDLSIIFNNDPAGILTIDLEIKP